MKSLVYIETPFGDFRFVETDLDTTCSCDVCALHDRGCCHLVNCSMFDHDFKSYHLVPHYIEKKDTL